MPIVRQVALDNVPLRNGPSSQKFSEEPMFIFFLQWELIIIIQIKWLILLLLDHGILYKPPKWPVLYDKCIRKSMVVCNLLLNYTYYYGWNSTGTTISVCCSLSHTRVMLWSHKIVRKIWSYESITSYEILIRKVSSGRLIY